MLSQIETGKSAPTINLLWKISTALGVPFATLLDNQKVHGPVVLRRQDAKILASGTASSSPAPCFRSMASARSSFTS